MYNPEQLKVYLGRWPQVYGMPLRPLYGPDGPSRPSNGPVGLHNKNQQFLENLFNIYNLFDFFIQSRSVKSIPGAVGPSIAPTTLNGPQWPQRPPLVHVGSRWPTNGPDGLHNKTQ